jgi:hypothetical protein
LKPGDLQSLRGVQAAIAETLVPELQSAFAQDAAQTLNMLLESLAGSLDSAVEDLVTNNKAVRGLLTEAARVFSTAADGNEQAAAIVRKCEEAIAVRPASRLLVSELTAESEALRGALEQVLVALEDIAAGSADAPAMALRRSIYTHLKTEAAAGWSFWDIASFREKMAALKSDISR